MDDKNPTQLGSLRVMYDPHRQRPVLLVDGAYYTLTNETAEGIAKALNAAVAVARNAAAAELN